MSVKTLTKQKHETQFNFSIYIKLKIIQEAWDKWKKKRKNNQNQQIF